MKTFEYYFCESTYDRTIDEEYAAMTPEQKVKCKFLEEMNYRLSYVDANAANLLKPDSENSNVWHAVRVNRHGNILNHETYDKNNEFIRNVIARWKKEDLQKRYGNETGEIVNDL